MTTTLLPEARIGVKKKTISASVLRELKPEKGIGIEKGSKKESYLVKLEKIRDFFLTKYKNDRSIFRQNLIRRQDEKRRVREEAIEKKENARKESKSKLLRKFRTPTLAKDIFKSIGNFLLYLAGGFLFNAFGGLEIGLKAISKTLEVIGVGVQIFANVVGGITDFIDLAYKGYDMMVKQISNITGLSEEQINDFSSKFNKLINGVLIASLIILRGLPGILLALSKRGGKPRITYGRGIGGSRGLGSTKYPKTRRPFLDRFRSNRRLDSPSTTSGTTGSAPKKGPSRVTGEFFTQGGKYSRSPVTNLGRRGLVTVLGKGGTKALFKFSKKFISPTLNKIPIVGPLIDFALNYFVFNEPIGRAAFKAIGSGLFSGLGLLLGGPFAAFTTIGGAFLGDAAGGALYDAIFGDKLVSTENNEYASIKKSATYDTPPDELVRNIIQPIVFA